MPTHTPSPHRFLASHTPIQQPKPKPQSSLRHTQTTSGTQTHDLATNTSRPTPAKRFVIAPTQTRAPSGDQRKTETGNDTHTQATPQARPGRKLKRVESIETSSQSSQLASQHDEQGVVQSVEHADKSGDEEAQDEEEDGIDILVTPRNPNKRRRLSQKLSSPVQPGFHGFLVPAPRTPALFSNSSAATQATATAASSRPHFLLPTHPPSPVKPSTPLPETFSPSRKGQKYIPGGLASTLQSWIVETANTGHAAQSRDAIVWGRDRDDGVKMRIRVSDLSSGKVGARESEGGEVECYPGSVVFVKGETDAALYNASLLSGKATAEVKFILAGQGGARGSGGVKVRIGSVVGVKAPLWDVDIGGETWMFGVDWVVLV